MCYGMIGITLCPPSAVCSQVSETIKEQFNTVYRRFSRYCLSAQKSEFDRHFFKPSVIDGLKLLSLLFGIDVSEEINMLPVSSRTFADFGS